MLHAVIMAGGSGTRFWPASRRQRPKQVLSLIGDEPLIRTTVRRILPLVPAENVWVVTTEATAELTRSILPELPAENVLVEPVGRDTTACVGFAGVVIGHRDPDAVCIVLPADHVIRQTSRFRRAMAAGAELVSRDGGLLTFGIRPTRPETGFGYLQVGIEHGSVEGWKVHRLARFVEKPDLETARGYLDEGGYLWNSGMFVWPVRELRAEIERQLPRLAEGLDRIADSLGTERSSSVVAEVYPTLQKISVDFGIMESAENCWVMPVRFPWSDVGAWPSLAELLDTDHEGNARRGRIVSVDCSDSILIGDGPVVAAAGIKDLIVVATPDAVLVVPASEAQRVKQIVAELEANDWDDVL